MITYFENVNFTLYQIIVESILDEIFLGSILTGNGFQTYPHDSRIVNDIYDGMFFWMFPNKTQSAVEPLIRNVKQWGYVTLVNFKIVTAAAEA